jgi:TrmH family RNA methyltransferase
MATANDEFQLLEALLGNRTKRHRQGRFLIQGVTQIDAALATRWPIDAVLVSIERRPSSWATGVLESVGDTEVIQMPEHLLDRLGQRDEGTEMILVGSLPSTDLTRRPIVDDAVWVLGENISNPGNLGTLLRSCDAFDAHGLVLTSRSADPFDPKAVRASTGSVFTVPIATVDSVASAAETLRVDPPPVRIIGLDEAGTPLDQVDLDGTLAVVAGSETRGLTRRAREACDEIAAIPMQGSVSSLNVAVATSIVLHEIRRRRA